MPIVPTNIIRRTEKRSKSTPAGGEVIAPKIDKTVAGRVIWVTDQPNSSISGGYSKGSVCTIIPLLAA